MGFLLFRKGCRNKGRPEGSIAVKGLGSQDFTADLIVLEGYFSVENDDLQLGFAESSRQKDELESFLIELGIPASEITFQAATYSELIGAYTTILESSLGMSPILD